MSGSNSNPLAGLYAQPPQPQQQQTNPMNQLGQMTNIIAQNNQNKAFQQEYAYKQAAGQIMQQAVDPQTGQVDYNKAFQAMATNPDTAWNAPAFLQDGIANQKIQADTAIQQLTARQTQFTAMTKAIEGLTANGPNATRGQDAMGAMAGLVANNIVSRDKAQSFVTNVLGNTPDGPELFNKLRGMAVQIQGANEAASGVLGHITALDQGGQIQLLNAAPTTGQATPIGQPIVKTPTTAERNTPTSQVNLANGGVTTGPAQDMISLKDGAGKPINSVNGPITTNLGPQANQVLTQYVPGLNDRVQNAQQALQGFNKMEDLSTQFRSGAGADARMKVAAGAQALGFPQNLVDNIAGKNGSTQDAAYAAMQEYIKMQVLNSMQTLRSAAGSQFSTDEFNTFRGALQSVGTDPRAMKGITQYMQRLAEMPGMEQQAFKKYQAAVSTGKTFTDAQGQAHPYQIGDWPSVWNQALVRSGKIKLITPGATAGLFGGAQGGGAQAPAGNGQ